MHRGILALFLTSLFVLFFDVSPLSSAPSRDMLRVQLVLSSQDKNVRISPERADEVSGYLKSRIPSYLCKNILRGEQRLILDFLTTPTDRNAVEQAISSIESSKAASGLKVEAWKPVKETLPPKRIEKSPKNITPRNIGPKEESKHFTLKRLGQDHFSMMARNVEFGLILEAISDSTNFSYVCPQEVCKRSLSANVERTSLSSLLTALKTALSLSIKRVGSLYVIAPQLSSEQRGG